MFGPSSHSAPRFGFCLTFPWVASRLLVTGASLVCLAVPAFQLLRGVSDFALDRRTRQQILEPILSDIQYELNKARTEPIGEAGTWILARGIWRLSTAVV